MNYLHFVRYYYAATGPGCLINCCKLCCFSARKLNEVQCQFINSRCNYCYCFLYILYRLLNKQLLQLPRKRSLSENRSYHISINKQRFCEHNNCCLPSLSFYSKQILYGVSLEMKFYSWTNRRQFSSIDLFLLYNPVTNYEANISQYSRIMML